MATTAPPAAVLAPAPAGAPDSAAVHTLAPAGAPDSAVMGMPRTGKGFEGQPADCFVVTCKNASMYGKRMRDVHIAGFSVQSDAVVRFRSSDGKVAVADLLVGVGRYAYVHLAQKAIYKMMEDSDGKLSDLDSLEVDKELFDQKVCTCLNNFAYLYQGPIWDPGTKVGPWYKSWTFQI